MKTAKAVTWMESPVTCPECSMDQDVAVQLLPLLNHSLQLEEGSTLVTTCIHCSMEFEVNEAESGPADKAKKDKKDKKDKKK